MENKFNENNLNENNNKPKLKHKNAYSNSIPYIKKTYRNNYQNKSDFYNKQNNNFDSGNKNHNQYKSNYCSSEDDFNENKDLEKNIKSALQQEEYLAFDFDDKNEFININESPVMKNTVKLNPEKTKKEKSNVRETGNKFKDNVQQEEPPTPAPAQQNDKNRCAEENTSSQILFGIVTKEDFIRLAKTYLLQLHDRGEMNVPMKSYPCDLYGKKCLIIPDINDGYLGYGNRPIPYDKLKSVLNKNGIFAAERLGRFNAVKQNWELYEDIGIKPLTDISVNGKYSDTVIMQIAEMAAALHSIPINNMSSLYEYAPINNSVESFVYAYQKYLNGYAEGISKGAGNIFSLFRFPKEKSEWMPIPAALPYSKNLCLCAINYSPNNIFLTDDGSTIISDWSSVGFAPASYDIANIIYILKLNKHQIQVLLDSYENYIKIQNKNFQKEVRIFRSVFVVKDAVDLLAGSYYSVKQETLKLKDAESTAEMLYESIKAAFKIWNYPEEKILAKESMIAAVKKWIRDKGPGKDEWIPEAESLDEWLEQHMSMYRGDNFYL